MTILPYGKRVIVSPIDDEKVTDGGIHLPDIAQKRPQKGRIVVESEGVSLQVGQVVVFPRFAGHEIDGFRILDEESILGVVQ